MYLPLHAWQEIRLKLYPEALPSQMIHVKSVLRRLAAGICGRESSMSCLYDRITIQINILRVNNLYTRACFR